MRKKAFFLCLTLIIIIVSFAWISLKTEIGLRIITTILSHQIELNVGHSAGTLIDGFSLRNTSINTKQQTITIGRLNSRIMLKNLLQGEIKIEYMTLNNLVIFTSKAKNAENVSPSITLPLPIIIEKGNVDKLSFITQSSGDTFSLKKVSFDQIIMNKKIFLRKLNILSDDFSIMLNGYAGLRENELIELTSSWAIRNKQERFFKGNGKIHGTFESLTIEQELDSPYKITLSGKITDVLSKNVKNIGVDFLASWRNFSLPINPDVNFSSKAGRLFLKGTLNNYSVKFVSDLSESGSTPEMNWEIIGQGNKDIITFQKIEAKSNNESLSAKGQINFSSNPTWKLAGEIHNIQNWRFHPDLKGALDFNVKAHGKLTNNAWKINLKDYKVTGTLNGNQVSGQGNATAWKDTITINNNSVNVGNNNILINGNISDMWNLNFSANAADLSQIYPEMSGKFMTHGKIEGPIEFPIIRGSLKANNLHVTDFVADKSEFSFFLDTQRDQLSALHMKVSNLQFKDYKTKTSEILLHGSAQKHSIRLSTSNQDLSVFINTDGDLSGQTYKSYINEFSIDYRNNPFSLAQPTQLTLSPLNISMTENICFSAEEKKICGKGQWSKPHGGEIRFNAKRFPIDLANTLFPENLKLSGRINADGFFRINNQLDITDGQIKLNGDTLAAHIDTPIGEKTYAIPTSHLSLSSNGQSTETLMKVDIKHLGFLNIHGRIESSLYHMISHPKSLNEIPIALDIAGKIEKADILSSIFTDIDKISGEANIAIKVSGTKINPKITGGIKLNDGNLEISKLGINLTKFNFQSMAHPDGTIKITASTLSGNGKIDIIGTFSFDQGQPQLSTHIAGKRFEIINTAEAKILVSPDINVVINPYRIKTEGTLHIPWANLEPKDLSSTIKQSDDLIFHTTGNSEVNRPWEVDSVLKITLGKKVKFNGFGLKGKIRGEIAVVGQPNQVTVGFGDLYVSDGIYDALNRNLLKNKQLSKLLNHELEIEKGKLRFIGGPLDNPGLEINAVRKIGNITANMQLSGSLKDPHSNVSCTSDIPVSQSDCLSYWVFGRPIKSTTSKQGQLINSSLSKLGITGSEMILKQVGDQLDLDEVKIDTEGNYDETALFLGKQISSRLYVRYSIGLILPVNIFKLEYRVNDHINLISESGLHQGADIIYSIDTD